MDLYSLLRQFADSWALLALVAWSLMIDWCAAPRGRRYPEETDR